MNHKTYSQKAHEVNRKTHIIDADGQILGKLATKIAGLLIGKHKVTYTPNIDDGDVVIVKNPHKVKLSRNKQDKKIYFWHTGYPGGLRQRTFKEMKERNPALIIRRAVKGMLPKNSFRKKRLARLKFKIDQEEK